MNILACDVTVWERSFMWHKNSRGPNTIPCGTPESREVASEEVPTITTVIFVKFHVLGVYLGVLH